MIQTKLLFYDFFIGELIFETSLHIGCSEIAADTDAPLLRDAEGRHYLPGTSIIGPMRARACELYKGQESLIGKVFGFQNDGIGAMSRIKIEDAYPKASSVKSSVRDGVAIDRKLGSARPRAKYDMEITPFDIRYPFSMRLELREEDKEKDQIDMAAMRSLVQHLVCEFEKGSIKLGGGKSRGLGRCKLKCIRYCLDFSNIADVAEFLLHRDPTKLPAIQPVEPVPFKSDQLDIEMVLSINDSPFLIKHGLEDDEYDAVFTKVMSKDGIETDYIPGASLKGVLRARAEKIVRTLGGTDAACAAVGGESCADTIRKVLGSDESNINNAAFLMLHSCPICCLFGNGCLASRIIFDDAFFDAAQEVRKKVSDNVAIDRFTGGAVEGKFFNSVPAVSGKIKVRLTVKDPTNFDQVLILFLLRDLKDGFPPIRFGYGKTKGYGLLECGEISVNSRKLDGRNFPGLLEKPPILDNWWKGEVNG